MKRNAILSILLAVVTIVSVSAQKKSLSICRLGFTYDISLNKNWGLNKPVVKSIYPYSSAERAGLKVYDVIEKINGVSVTDIARDEIPQLLNRVGEKEVLLTISNLSSSDKQVLIKKDFKKQNAITEDQLASAYSMYSVETTFDREFVCPFKTTITQDTVNFGIFRTFAFAPIDENNRKLETVINEAIRVELEKRGLKEDVVQPDLLIQTFYFFDKNLNYVGKNKVQVNNEKTYRYNSAHNKMEVMPFLNASASEAEAEFLLQFGIRIVDQKEVNGRVIWECESNELLEKSFRMDEYARIHVPLMCMQFPYMKYSQNVPFRVSKKTYNYTGISYDIDKLDQVVAVEPNSPAHLAGVRANDEIERINRHKMHYSAEEFSDAYKRFITNTMQMRDMSTIFTDVNGFKFCMSWNSEKYNQIADAAQDSDYLPAFSYLYFFTPYINPTGNNACTFNVKRDKSETEIIIRPTIRTEVTLEIK